MNPTQTRPMTARQVSYIRDLIATRVMLVTDRARLLGLLDCPGNGQDTRWASDVIAWLLRRDKLAQPISVPAASPEKLVIGVYRRDGQLYVVRPTRAQHLAAYRVVEIGGQRVTQVGETVGFELRYARGMMAELHMADRLPLEAAEKLMIRYGRCVCCSRPLKDATSVKNGIGPVCAKRFFG